MCLLYITCVPAASCCFLFLAQEAKKKEKAKQDREKKAKAKAKIEAKTKVGEAGRVGKVGLNRRSH